MVMCPKQKQNANWSQVEIEILILKGRNLPRTNSTKSETQNIFPKKQQNEHTPVKFLVFLILVGVSCDQWIQDFPEREAANYWVWNKEAIIW